ncbi:protein SPT2 homolog [Episyrphus balteatus]|uniref:protein SPT2 homolog n=1 Tax=Episyrphus balteatus TaxID=286459 RepID=UPI00248655EF|nr:protein SPT2 homolog [Episyrphus balteatus]
MDFGALLHVAKKNSETTKDADGKYYSTKFAPPKKESKDKKLSHNIQKFLAKKEQEERERQRLEKQKLDQLMALRDEKSKNKIKKMLKVTKSANKSVLDDAVDMDHTAVTREGGEQPDQDDYGYVSNEANAFYQKYIEKVKDVKEDKQFAPSRPATRTDLNSTKDRVKAAIEREILERNMPHTRVRTSTAAPKLASALMTTGSLRKKDLYDPEAEREMEEKKKREEEQQRRAKNKKPPPPVMDFQALLKLAEKKQFEPVVVEVEPKKKEPERLLTKKERKEQEERQKFMEERERRKKEMEKGGGKSSAAAPPKAPERQKMEPNGRIPKLNQSAAAPKAPSSSSTASSSSKSVDTKSATFKKPLNPVSASSSSSQKSSHPSSKMSSSPAASKSTSSSARPLTNGGTSSSSKDKPSQKAYPPPSKLSSSSSSSSKPNSAASSKSALSQNGGTSSKSALSQNGGKGSYNGPTREFPPKDVKARTQQAPAQTTRQFPPSDVRRSNKPPERKPQQPVKRRIYDDDDEDEYDSDLDDFIDDGPDGEDYSQHIKAIFGYDKSRYRDIDEDDSGMESTFAQQMREEYVSKKIGLMEDLEDMRQEAEDKKRKASMKRKKVH